MSNACFGVFKGLRSSCSSVSASVGGFKHAQPYISPSFAVAFNARKGLLNDSRRFASNCRNAHIVISITRFARSFHTNQACFARKRGPPASRVKESPTHIKRAAQFPFGDQSAEEISTIFGQDVSRVEANAVLRTLHRRRASGSLVELGVHIEKSSIPAEASVKALEWLREKYPVDEQAAANRWADTEAEKLQQTYIARAEKLGLYKKEDIETPRRPRRIYRREPRIPSRDMEVNPANSVIDEMRIYNERKAKRDLVKRKISGEEARSQSLALAKSERTLQAIELHIKKLEEHRAKDAIASRVAQFEEPPETSSWQRLYPATTFVAVVLAWCGYVAYAYRPPTSRLFSDLPPALATCNGIMMICVVVTCAWYQTIPTLRRFMNMYMTVVPVYPHAVSIVGNIWSHQSFKHLAANMSGLYFFGMDLHEDVGRGNFIALYVGGGALGSLASLYWWVLKGRVSTTHMGASGAMWAIMGAWSYLNLFKPLPSMDDWAFSLRCSRYAVIAFHIPAHFIPAVWASVDVIAHGMGFLSGIGGAIIMKKTAEQRIDTEKDSPT